MKITLPLARKEHVGTRVRYEDDQFFFDDRGTVQGATVEIPMYDVTVKPTVVFDKDFFIVRRGKSAIAFAVFNAAVVLMLPLAAAALAFEKLDEMLTKACNLYADKATQFLKLLGHRPYGFLSTNKAMLKSVFA